MIVFISPMIYNNNNNNNNKKNNNKNNNEKIGNIDNKHKNINNGYIHFCNS